MGMMIHRSKKRVEAKQAATVNDTVSEKTQITHTYTKTDINRMTTAELQAFALEKGIDGANNMTGGDLKKVLIEKLGL